MKEKKRKKGSEVKWEVGVNRVSLFSDALCSCFFWRWVGKVGIVVRVGWF